MNTNYINMPWETAAIFVSSTFVDMNEERDVLNSYVLPKLNEHFYSNRINVQLVDLRWGVRTTEIENEVDRDNKVLTVCFDEIDRSQPFFVAILGDRYGYDSLDKNIIDSISYKLNDSFLIDSSDLYKKSVTELEILYGALLHPDEQLSNSVFCMRQADYTGMSDSYAKQYISNKDKMDTLRGKIFNSCKQNNTSKSIINYHVSGWNNETGRFDSFDKAEFGELLYERLVTLISKHFDTLAETKMSFPEQLQYEQETFLGSADNVETDMMNDRILALLGKSHQLNIIQGESGIGKTTLLKHLAKHLFTESNKNKHVFYFNAGLSARCREVKKMLICWMWQIEKIIGGDVYDLEKSNEEDLRIVFERKLQKCAEQGHEFIFIIDSYDSLYKNPVSESLSFLRFATKSFVSTQLETKIHFHQDLDSQIQMLRGLSQDEAKQMMKNLFKSLHKDEYPQLYNSIKSKFEGDINPLWIELAVNFLSKLSAKDFANIRKSQSSTNNGSEAIEQYLISTFNDFPFQVGQLFGYLYNKAFEDENWSFSEQYIIWLIALSRNGIRESDLAALTKKQGWDTLLFARIRYYFHSCIKEKSFDNCWGFNHEIYNRVLMIHLAKTGERMNVNLPEMLHGALGHHYVYCEQNYDLRISECVYHLIRGNDKESTAIFLLNSDALNDIENEYSCAVREVADFIVESNEEDIKYLQAPKDMPIPEFGYIHNDAIGWLMDVFHINLPIDNWNLGRLMKIFSIEVNNHLQERGEIMSSYFLNIRLLDEVEHMKDVIPEEDRLALADLIQMNCNKARHLLGRTDDIVFSKNANDDNAGEEGEDASNEDDLETMKEIMSFVTKVENAKREEYGGNYEDAISLCEQLLINIDGYKGRIPVDILEEGKVKCLMCQADSYLRIGDEIKALEIYNNLEKKIDNGSDRWFLLHERIYQVYYDQQDQKCLDIAREYLALAENKFNENHSVYKNCETLMLALVLYVRALKVSDAKSIDIEKCINRAEQFFRQIHGDKQNKQLLQVFSYLKEFEGEFYYEIGKINESETALKMRLEICEFISRKEMTDSNAQRDYAKSYEDLGAFYASVQKYKESHAAFSEAIRIISHWEDSEEKQVRLASLYLDDSRVIMSINANDAKDQIARYQSAISGFALMQEEARNYFREKMYSTIL